MSTNPRFTGSYEAQFKAWGEYIQANHYRHLKVKDHEELYQLGKDARKNGWTDEQIDKWIKEGRKREARYA